MLSTEFCEYRGHGSCALFTRTKDLSIILTRKNKERRIQPNHWFQFIRVSPLLCFLLFLLVLLIFSVPCFYLFLTPQKKKKNYVRFSLLIWPLFFLFFFFFFSLSFLFFIFILYFFGLMISHWSCSYTFFLPDRHHFSILGPHQDHGTCNDICKLIPVHYLTKLGQQIHHEIVGERERERRRGESELISTLC